MDLTTDHQDVLLAVEARGRIGPQLRLRLGAGRVDQVLDDLQDAGYIFDITEPRTRWALTLDGRTLAQRIRHRRENRPSALTGKTPVEVHEEIQRRR